MRTCSKCGGTFYCPEDDFYYHVTRCQGQKSTEHRSAQLAEAQADLRQAQATVAALTKALDDLYTVALGAHADTCGDLPTRRAIAQARVLLEKQQPESDAARMEALANGERGDK